MNFEGRPVVDAVEPLAIQGDASHIRRGKAQDPQNCAVACAARARTDVIEAQVGARYAYLRLANDPDVWTRYRLTDAGVEMVYEFDKYTAAVKATAPWVQHWAIDLKRPSPSRRLGVKHSQKRTGNGPSRPSQVGRRPSLRHVMIRSTDAQ